MKKQEARVAAAIDIGSSAVRMCVSQWARNHLTPLDRLEVPIRIGHEVFATGRVGFDAMRELSAVLEGFEEAARAYGVERPRVIATTAFREAYNRANVLDHLRIRNHMDVDVLEEGEVNALIYQEMLRQLEKPPESILLANVGTGTMGLALLENGLIVHARSLRAGTLRISDMIGQVAAVTQHIDRAAEEYFDDFLAMARCARDFSGAQAVAVSSHAPEALHAICGAQEVKGVSVIHSDKLQIAWAQHRALTPEQLALRCGIPPEEGARVYALMVVYAGVQKLTGAQYIYSPRAELLDSFLSLQLRPNVRRAHEEFLRAGMLASARELARHYRCDENHAAAVAAAAMMLFEKLRKVHGLSRRQGTLLEAACLLHECGFYTGSSDARAVARALVSETGLYLTRERDSQLIGLIIAARDAQSGDDWSEAYHLLPEEDTMFVAKMYTLLHVADALDASRAQKAKIQDVEVKRNQMIVRLAARDDYALEQWAFSQTAPLFEEVFGIMPRLEIIKR